MNSADLKLQRDQALACLILALCASAAVFLSVYGSGDRLAVEAARGRAALHEGLLRQSAVVLGQNQGALAAARSALSAREGAPRR
jgi:hypothetical protein